MPSNIVASEVDPANSTTTPLGTGGVFLGEWRAFGPVIGALQFSVATDVGGDRAFVLEISTDNGDTIDRMVGIDVPNYDPIGGGSEFTIPREGTHYRVRYTNPNGAQQFLRITTTRLATHGEKSVPLNDELEPNSSAIVTKGVIEGRSSAGDGTYVDVKVTPAGALVVSGGGGGGPGVDPIGVRGTDQINEASPTNPFDVQVQNFPADNEDGTWGYAAGTSGTVAVTGRVLQITAVALGSAGSIQINGGNTIPLPYDTITQASSSLTIEPKGNLIDPSVTFTGTDSYLIEFIN